MNIGDTSMSSSYLSGFAFTTAKGVPLLTCPALAVPHGFSTRLGGVSHGEGLDTLDLGMGTPDKVSENRRRFARGIGAAPSRLITARQIHSAKVETVTAKDVGRPYECDGFVTREEDLFLTVKTADCVPILLCDPHHRVIGAVHAGWRGTVAGIAAEVVKAMCTLGADPSRIVAAIGPCIHSDCYEVDDPFVSAVAASEHGKALLRYVLPNTQKEGHYRADLPQMNRFLLEIAGVSAARIFASGFCTCCSSHLFYSHRASKGKRGLQMAGIFLPKASR